MGYSVRSRSILERSRKYASERVLSPILSEKPLHEEYNEDHEVLDQRDWTKIKEFASFFGTGSLIIEEESTSDSPFRRFNRLQNAIIEYEEIRISNIFIQAIEACDHLQNSLTHSSRSWSYDDCSTVGVSCIFFLDKLERNITKHTDISNQRMCSSLGHGLFSDEGGKARISAYLQSFLSQTTRIIETVKAIQKSKDGEEASSKVSNESQLQSFLHYVQKNLDVGLSGGLNDASKEELKCEDDRLAVKRPGSSNEMLFASYKWATYTKDPMGSRELDKCTCSVRCKKCSGVNVGWEWFATWHPCNSVYMPNWFQPGLPSPLHVNLVSPDWHTRDGAIVEGFSLYAPTNVGMSLILSTIDAITSCQYVHSGTSSSKSRRCTGLEQDPLAYKCVVRSRIQLETTLGCSRVLSNFVRYNNWCNHTLALRRASLKNSIQDKEFAVGNALLIGTDYICVEALLDSLNLLDRKMRSLMKNTMKLVLNTARVSAKDIMMNMCEMHLVRKTRRGSLIRLRREEENTARATHPFQTMTMKLLLNHLNAIGATWKTFALRTFRQLNIEQYGRVEAILLEVAQALLQSLADFVLSDYNQKFDEAMIDDLEFAVENIQDWLLQIVKDSVSVDREGLNVQVKVNPINTHAQSLVEKLPALKTWKLIIRALRLPASFKREDHVIHMSKSDPQYSEVVQLFDDLPDLDLWLNLRMRTKRRFSLPWFGAN